MNAYNPDELAPAFELKGQKDPLLVLLRELNTPKGREENQCYFADNHEMVLRAFEYDAKVKYVIFADKEEISTEGIAIRKLAKEKDTPVYKTTSGMLSKMISSKPTPLSVVVVEREIQTVDDLLDSGSFFVMVHDLEFVDNLGMLLRSAEASGVDGIIFSGKTTDPFHRKAVRGSRGAVYHLQMAFEEDFNRMVQKAQERGIQLIGTSANEGQLYTDIDLKKPSLLITGNEHTGLLAEHREQVDFLAQIPMNGKINSLNVSVAASLMMYELIRQRRG